jgi:SAM-dependent methyltransferase
VAEELPFDADTFDASLASLVVAFMRDPVAGVRGMRRVTRPGGRVALCFWTQDAMPLLATFWRAANTVISPTEGEDRWLGREPGDLLRLLEQVGVGDVVESRLACSATYADLDDWWSSFTGGAGPVGAYQQSLSPDQRARVRDECDRLLGRPRSPFTLEAFVWCAVGTVPAA